MKTTSDIFFIVGSTLETVRKQSNDDLKLKRNYSHYLSERSFTCYEVNNKRHFR
jgi:hypothetical protein